jgi:hypothetical protein
VGLFSDVGPHRDPGANSRHLIHAHHQISDGNNRTTEQRALVPASEYRDLDENSFQAPKQNSNMFPLSSCMQSLHTCIQTWKSHARCNSYACVGGPHDAEEIPEFCATKLRWNLTKKCGNVKMCWNKHWFSTHIVFLCATGSDLVYIYIYIYIYMYIHTCMFEYACVHIAYTNTHKEHDVTPREEAWETFCRYIISVCIYILYTSISSN